MILIFFKRVSYSTQIITISCILTLCLFNLSGFSQTSVYAKSNLNLRSAPTSYSQSLLIIPKGTIIEKYECTGNWCNVQYAGYSGYISQKYIHKIVKDNRGKGYINTNEEWVQSPTYYDSPPANATAECRDGTYSFSHSRRGTCSHHGGVKRWL